MYKFEEYWLFLIVILTFFTMLQLLQVFNEDFATEYTLRPGSYVIPIPSNSKTAIITLQRDLTSSPNTSVNRGVGSTVLTYPLSTSARSINVIVGNGVIRATHETLQRYIGTCIGDISNEEATIVFE